MLSLSLVSCAAQMGGAPMTDTPTHEAVSRLEHDVAAARMAFGSALAHADADRCTQLCQHHRHICRLAQRICDIARGDEQLQPACERSKKQCADTRLLMPLECGCSSPGPLTP